MRPFPLGAPLPQPRPAPALCLSQHGFNPKILPRRVPKRLLGWGGVFLGGRFYSASPWAKPSCPAQPLPPPCKHFPWDLIFGVILGGFLIIISKWPFKFSTSGSAFEGVFRFLYLLVLYGVKNHRNKPSRCSLYTVLRSFCEGREIFPQRQSWFSSSGPFLGFAFFSNDYFFIVVVKMSVAFQVSVSLAMK